MNQKKSDILITTGGISVGDHDLVKSVLKKLGFNIVFWKVAMRPGKPILFAKHKNMIVLCFPGNPVSTFVASIIFLLPLIQKLFNLNYKLPIKTALLAKDLRKNDNREDYIRAKIKYLKNNQIIAEPFQKQDSSMTLILNKSEGLIIRKPFAKSVKAGSSVSVIPFSSINTII